MTRTVATQLFRLMAIKDEYEVARLHSDPSFRQSLDDQFEGHFKLRFHLAPPLFSRPDKVTGKVRKIELGGWMLPVFRLLARCKGLRGSRLDPFSYLQERRDEQADLSHYVNLLQTILGGISPSNYDSAVALANSPSKLRGYGHVKARNRAAVMSEQRALLTRFRQQQPILAVNAAEAA